MNRRTLLTGAAAAAMIRPSRLPGANDRIRIGVIGTGGRGQYLARLLKANPAAELVAACDVYEPRRLQAVAAMGAEAKAFVDYHEVLARTDIDAVVIATTDHWHVPVAIDGLSAGKDIYVEKPVTHSVDEGSRLLEAAAKANKVVATGTQQRSWPVYLQAKELWGSGALGRMLNAECYWFSTPWITESGKLGIEQDKLDWKRWLGAAPEQPFLDLKFLRWRNFWDFGGGAFSDLMTHWIDVVQWFTGQAKPKALYATGTKAEPEPLQTPATTNALIEYPNEVIATYGGSSQASWSQSGILFRGSEGMMRLTRAGYLLYRGESKSVTGDLGWPEPVELVKSAGDGTRDNLDDWLACIRSRGTPKASLQAGVDAAHTTHLCNQAVRHQRSL